MPIGHPRSPGDGPGEPRRTATTVLIVEDRAQVEQFAGLLDEARPVAEKREYVTVTGRKGKLAISCTSTGMGSPATSIGVEELWHIGAKNILRLGTCLPIQSRIGPNRVGKFGLLQPIADAIKLIQKEALTPKGGGRIPPRWPTRSSRRSERASGASWSWPCNDPRRAPSHDPCGLRAELLDL